MVWSKRTAVTVGLMLGVLLGALDQMITATALPAIAGELGGLSFMAWATGSYLLTATTLVPITGKMADLFGRRRVYLAGMSAFVIGSALCGAATSMPMLILFRAVQGIGGGMLSPVAQTIIGDLYPGIARARMQAVVNAVFGLATVFGPKMGGWMVDNWSWRWVFYMNLPFGILAMLLIVWNLAERTLTKKPSIDYLGALVIASGTSLLLLGFLAGGRFYPWTSWQELALLVSGGALLSLFVRIERTAADPLLPLGLFRSRVFLVTIGVVFFMGLGMYGSLIFIPLFMQDVVGLTASESGSIIMPMTLGMVVASLASAKLLLRIGYRMQLVAGMSALAVGYYFLSTMNVQTAVGTVVAYLVICGLGLGLVLPTTTVAIQNGFPEQQRGVVTSAASFFRSIGGTIGITLLSVVMNHRASSLLNAQLPQLLATVRPSEMGALAPVREMLRQNPQSLFGLVGSPDGLKNMPQGIREPFVLIVKDSLTRSLDLVFLTGGAMLALGAVVALFMGKKRYEAVQPDTPQQSAGNS